MKIQSYFSKFLLISPDLKCSNDDLAITRKIKAHMLRNYFFPNSEMIGYTNIKKKFFPLDLSKIIQIYEIREIIRK
jgi:hypothetical protein